MALASAGSALAADGVNGSPSGIALARSVAHVYTFVASLRYHETGFVYYDAAAGKAFRWHWGSGPASGFVAAEEHAELRLRAGRVIWWRDELTPICSGRCTTPTVVLVLDSAGAFYAYRSGASTSCFGRLGGTTPYAAGAPVYSVTGSYSPPLTRGAVALLSSTYGWTATQRATQTDTISRRTRLPVKTVVRVGPRSGGPAAFVFTAVFGNLPHTPPPPTIRRCR